MRRFVAAGLLLVATTACVWERRPETIGSYDANEPTSSPLDNLALDYEAQWTAVDPEYRFDRRSSANRLVRPEWLVGADLGYFGDPAIINQYTRKQQAEMTHDRAGFVATADEDGDGSPETYRTGFWKMSDGRRGTFLVVFDKGVQAGLVDTTVDGNHGVFLSQWSGHFVVSDCNCRFMQDVTYQSRHLTVTPGW